MAYPTLATPTLSPPVGTTQGNWLMCPITFLLLSSIVPLWYVGGDDGYGEEEMMGMGRRWYGEEEMMVWGGDGGYGRRR